MIHSKKSSQLKARKSRQGTLRSQESDELYSSSLSSASFENVSSFCSSNSEEVHERKDVPVLNVQESVECSNILPKEDLYNNQQDILVNFGDEINEDNMSVIESDELASFDIVRLNHLRRTFLQIKQETLLQQQQLLQGGKEPEREWTVIPDLKKPASSSKSSPSCVVNITEGSSFVQNLRDNVDGDNDSDSDFLHVKEGTDNGYDDDDPVVILSENSRLSLPWQSAPFSDDLIPPNPTDHDHNSLVWVSTMSSASTMPASQAANLSWESPNQLFYSHDSHDSYGKDPVTVGGKFDLIKSIESHAVVCGERRDFSPDYYKSVQTGYGCCPVATVVLSPGSFKSDADDPCMINADDGTLSKDIGRSSFVKSCMRRYVHARIGTVVASIITVSTLLMTFWWVAWQDHAVILDIECSKQLTLVLPSVGLQAASARTVTLNTDVKEIRGNATVTAPNGLSRFTDNNRNTLTAQNYSFNSHGSFITLFDKEKKIIADAESCPITNVSTNLQLIKTFFVSDANVTLPRYTLKRFHTMQAFVSQQRRRHYMNIETALSDEFNDEHNNVQSSKRNIQNMKQFNLYGSQNVDDGTFGQRDRHYRSWRFHDILLGENDIDKYDNDFFLTPPLENRAVADLMRQFMLSHYKDSDNKKRIHETAQ